MRNPDFISMACLCHTLAHELKNSLRTWSGHSKKHIFFPSLSCALHYINNKLESKGLRFRREGFLSSFSRVLGEPDLEAGKC